MTSPLKEIVGTACFTFLFLRVHHPAWVVSDFHLLLDSGDCCVGVTGCFVDKPVVCKCKHLA